MPRTLSVSPIDGEHPEFGDDLDNRVADGIESLRQRIQQRLQFRLGEWELDTTPWHPVGNRIYLHAQLGGSGYQRGDTGRRGSRSNGVAGCAGNAGRRNARLLLRCYRGYDLRRDAVDGNGGLVYTASERCCRAGCGALATRQRFP